jgi:hypothetical protein
MQTETQQDLPLKEVSAGDANCVRGVALCANNLIDGSHHGSVDIFTGVNCTCSMHYWAEFWRFCFRKEKRQGLQTNAFTSLAARLWLILMDRVSASYALNFCAACRVTG